MISNSLISQGHIQSLFVYHDRPPYPSYLAAQISDAATAGL